MANPYFVPIIGSGPNAFSDIAQQQQHWAGFNNQVDQANLERAAQAAKVRNDWMAQVAQARDAADQRDLSTQLAQNAQDRQYATQQGQEATRQRERAQDIATNKTQWEERLAAEDRRTKAQFDLPKQEEAKRLAAVEHTGNFLAPDLADAGTKRDAAEERYNTELQNFQTIRSKLEAGLPPQRWDVKRGEFAGKSTDDAGMLAKIQKANEDLSNAKARFSAAEATYNTHLNTFDTLRKNASQMGLEVGKRNGKWVLYSPHLNKTFGDTGGEGTPSPAPSPLDPSSYRIDPSISGPADSFPLKAPRGALPNWQQSFGAPSAAAPAPTPAPVTATAPGPAPGMAPPTTGTTPPPPVAPAPSSSGGSPILSAIGTAARATVMPGSLYFGFGGGQQSPEALPPPPVEPTYTPTPTPDWSAYSRNANASAGNWFGAAANTLGGANVAATPDMPPPPVPSQPPVAPAPPSVGVSPMLPALATAARAAIAPSYAGFGGGQPAPAPQAPPPPPQAAPAGPTDWDAYNREQHAKAAAFWKRIGGYLGGGNVVNAPDLGKEFPPAPPNPADRQYGQIYLTPKGPMQWIGKGWIPPT